MVLWWRTRPSRTNVKKRCPFHHRGLECKSRKSRDTWSNRQVWPWNTKWSRAKANRVLPREHTGHRKHPLPIIHEMTLPMDITKWSMLKSDWLHPLQPKMEKLYTVINNKTWSYCGSDHELLIAKYSLKWKNLGLIWSRFNLNQNPYNYTVEVTNRFKGLDLVDRVHEEL